MPMLAIDKSKNPVGHALREYRIHVAKMPQEAFAAEIGVAGSTVSFWEIGQTKPSGEALKALKKRFPDLHLPFTPSREKKSGGSGGARPHPKRKAPAPGSMVPNAQLPRPWVDTGIPLPSALPQKPSIAAVLAQAYFHIDDPAFRALIEALAGITEIQRVARLLRAADNAGLRLSELADVFEKRAKEKNRG